MQAKFTRIETSIFSKMSLWSSCIDCGVSKIYEDDAFKIFKMRDNGQSCYKPQRKVIYYTSTWEEKYSCKLFELEGILRLILLMLRGDFMKEIPPSLVLNRWTKI